MNLKELIISKNYYLSLKRSNIMQLIKSKQSYVWVFGDIHGMIQPLQSLYKFILDNYIIDRVIFLGDYIDRGNDSKKVLDFLINLQENHIFIMGNHEQLLLDILSGQINYKIGLKYFHQNGGRKTLESFSCKNFKEFADKFDSNYMSFMKELKYSHILDSSKFLNDIIFLHAGFTSKIPIAEQLSVKTIEDYHFLIKKYKLNYNDTFLWAREDFYAMDSEKWDNKLVVHGHTPVHLLQSFLKNLPHINISPKKYLNSEFYEYALFHDTRPFFRLKKTSQRVFVISINVDTGCANERRLSAIGLDIENAKDNKLPAILIQIDTLSNKIFEFRTQISF